MLQCVLILCHYMASQKKIFCRRLNELLHGLNDVKKSMTAYKKKFRRKEGNYYFQFLREEFIVIYENIVSSNYLNTILTDLQSVGSRCRNNCMEGILKKKKNKNKKLFAFTKKLFIKIKFFI